MKKLFLLVLSGIVLYGCSGNQSDNQTSEAPKSNAEAPIAIINDMESALAGVPSWINEKTIVEMPDGAKAHSGKYVSLVNGDATFSYTFRETFSNINQKLPTAVIVEGWFYPTAPIGKEGVVLEVKEGKETVIWKSYSIASEDVQLNDWNNFKARFTMDKQIKDDHQLKVYAIGKDKNLYFDDFKISFEY